MVKNRTIEDINNEIKSLIKERETIFKEQSKNIDLDKYIGKYILYTEETKLNTLMQFKTSKTYVMKVSDVKIKCNNFILFNGYGIIKDINHYGDEMFNISLNLNFTIFDFENIENVKIIDDEIFLDNLNNVHSVYDKIINKENGLKNGEIIVYSKVEMNKLMKKYNCKTENDLDEHLWYEFGISLINKIE